MKESAGHTHGRRHRQAASGGGSHHANLPCCASRSPIRPEPAQAAGGPPDPAWSVGPTGPLTSRTGGTADNGGSFRDRHRGSHPTQSGAIRIRKAPPSTHRRPKPAPAPLNVFQSRSRAGSTPTQPCSAAPRSTGRTAGAVTDPLASVVVSIHLRSGRSQERKPRLLIERKMRGSRRRRRFVTHPSLSRFHSLRRKITSIKA